MTGRSPRRLGTRATLLGLALGVLSAAPGVAIASLPAHAAPTHACCMAPDAMPSAADCETAPCCIEKPAPRAFSVMTGSAAPLVPAVVNATVIAPIPAPAAVENPAPVPRARSAPLFLLFVALLN